MSLSEEERFELREAFRRQFGEDLASAMMEAYPPAGLEGAALAGAMAELRLEMADLRTELKGEMAGLRTELHVLYRRQTLALAAMMAAGWGGVAALVGLQ